MAEEQAKDEVSLDNLDEALKLAMETEEDVPDDEVLDPVEYTDKEQKAMALGWNPDEESLKGSDKDWIPAEEFLRNQSFFDEIKKLKREVRSQRKVTEAFKAQNQIVSEKAYDKAVKDLKAKKLQAAEDEDFGKILQIDDQLEELHNDKQNNAAITQADHTKEEWDTAFEEFVESNPWYTNNRVMQAFADTIGGQYAGTHPGITPDQLYDHVMGEIKKEFPDKEQVPGKQARAQKVTTPARRTRSAGSASKHTVADIPEDHKQIAMTLIKSGSVSEEDYLKQYFPEDYS